MGNNTIYAYQIVDQQTDTTVKVEDLVNGKAANTQTFQGKYPVVVDPGNGDIGYFDDNGDFIVLQ